MSLAELLPHLVTLAVGLLGGGGVAALIKARREVFVLGTDIALKSLQTALSEADDDNAALRAEVKQLRVELAEERRCRVALERRLARLEDGSHGPPVTPPSS